jgi:nucleoid DNA-binding protein
MPSRKLTQSQFRAKIADKTGLSKRDVSAVIDALNDVVVSELRGAAGQVSPFPGLTLRKKDTPAKPARPGRNPATGEMMTFKAKPASKTVRASVQKRLKDSVL